MAIEFDPKKILSEIIPKSKIEKLISPTGAFKRSALKFLDKLNFINKKDITRTALKAFNSYKKRIKDEPDLEFQILKDPKLLIQRVQNDVIYQIGQEIKTKYAGEFYEWLPSDAEEPDPEHQLLYGTIRQVGVGEQPAERFGCRCGMRILVKEETLNL